MRHLRVKELWLQEAVRECRLKVFYVPGQSNVADLLTKALPRERFEHLADVLGVRGPDSTARQRGSQAPIQMIGAIMTSDGPTTGLQDDNPRGPSISISKLHLDYRTQEASPGVERLDCLLQGLGLKQPH
jgi:hypothetical protein